VLEGDGRVVDEDRVWSGGGLQNDDTVGAMPVNPRLESTGCETGLSGL
jgi:hypothetical protein